MMSLENEMEVELPEESGIPPEETTMDPPLLPTDTSDSPSTVDESSAVAELTSDNNDDEDKKLAEKRSKRKNSQNTQGGGDSQMSSTPDDSNQSMDDAKPRKSLRSSVINESDPLKIKLKISKMTDSPKSSDSPRSVDSPKAVVDSGKAARASRNSLKREDSDEDVKKKLRPRKEDEEAKKEEIVEEAPVRKRGRPPNPENRKEEDGEEKVEKVVRKRGRPSLGEKRKDEEDEDEGDRIVRKRGRPTNEEKRKEEERRSRNKTDQGDGDVLDPATAFCFCWVCHKAYASLPCDTCPRTFHHRCVSYVKPPAVTQSSAASTGVNKSWICPECSSVLHAESLTTRSQAMRSVTLDQLCTLLKFTVSRMKNVPDSETFWTPVDQQAVPHYSKYIKHPMDLSTLEQNIKKQMYGSTVAFVGDSKWLLHNSIVFNSTQSGLTATARALVKVCKQEMGEIENCPDCYLNAHTKSDWFTAVCRKPHILIWARLKGFPFWPAKAMSTNLKSQSVDARFFGAHDKAWVPVKECYLYSKNSPVVATVKRKADLDEAFDEAKEYITHIKEKYGKFIFAPEKTPFEPENLDQQLLSMIPGCLPEKSERRGEEEGEVEKPLAEPEKPANSPRFRLKRPSFPKPLPPAPDGRVGGKPPTPLTTMSDDIAGEERIVASEESVSPEEEVARSLEMFDTGVANDGDDCSTTTTDAEDGMMGVTPEHGYSRYHGVKSQEAATEDKPVETEITEQTNSETVEKDGSAEAGSEKSDELSEVTSEDKPTEAKDKEGKIFSSLSEGEKQKVVGEARLLAGIDEMDASGKKRVLNELGLDEAHVDVGKMAEENRQIVEAVDKLDKTEGEREEKRRGDKRKEKRERSLRSDGKESGSDRKEVEDGGKERKDSESVRKEGRSDRKEGKSDRKEERGDRKENEGDRRDRKSDRKEKSVDRKEKSVDRKEKSVDRKEKSVDRKEGESERKDGKKDRKESVDSKDGKKDRKESVDSKDGKKDRKESVDSREGKNDMKDGEGERKEGKSERKELRSGKKDKRDTKNRSDKTAEEKEDDKPVEEVQIKNEDFEQYLAEENSEIDGSQTRTRIKVRDFNALSTGENPKCFGEPMLKIMDVRTLKDLQGAGSKPVTATKRKKSTEEKKGWKNGKQSRLEPVLELKKVDSSVNVRQLNRRLRLSDQVSLLVLPEANGKPEKTVDLDTDTDTNSSTEGLPIPRVTPVGIKPKPAPPRARKSMPTRKENTVTISTNTSETSVQKTPPKNISVISVDTRQSDAQKNLLKSLCLEEKRPTEKGDGKTDCPVVPNQLILTNNGQTFITGQGGQVQNLALTQNNLGQLSLVHLTNLTSGIQTNFVSLANETIGFSNGFGGTLYATPTMAGSVGGAPVLLQGLPPGLAPAINISPTGTTGGGTGASTPSNPKQTAKAVSKTQTISVKSPASLGLASPASKQPPPPLLVGRPEEGGPSGVGPGSGAPADAAGPLSIEINKHAAKMSEYMKTTIEEILQSLGGAGSLEAKVQSLTLELERSAWRHQQEVTDLRQTTERRLEEMRGNLEAERNKALSELRSAMEQQHEKQVAETKRRQWCAHCGKEALFYCCWNTSYCDYPCQQAHWPGHMTACAQLGNTPLQNKTPNIKYQNQNSNPHPNSGYVAVRPGQSPAQHNATVFNRTMSSTPVQAPSQLRRPNEGAGLPINITLRPQHYFV